MRRFRSSMDVLLRPSARMKTTRNVAVNTTLRDRDDFLADVQHCLHHAQQHDKLYYDGKPRLLIFDVGDWLWL